MTKIDVNELTIGEARALMTELSEYVSAPPPVTKRTKDRVPLPFQAGDAILIRTVTMIQLGRVKSIGSDFLVLEDGGWVAETARFSETLASGKLTEFERAPSWFLVGRGAIVDVYPWKHPIPETTK